MVDGLNGIPGQLAVLPHMMLESELESVFAVDRLHNMVEIHVQGGEVRKKRQILSFAIEVSITIF